MTPTGEPVVEIEDARVALGGARILDGVDLTIHPGELVALLGANGSGKSTLLRALLGIHPLEGGSAKLFGVSSQRSRAHTRLGYVPQDSADAGSIPATARETVAAGLLGPGRWFLRPGDARVERALEAVGMADLAGRPVTRMSGGQRRRVLIARALVRAPRLLILDEPFAGIDLASQDSIARLFRELHADGVSILVVLHELGPLEPDITRAVVLDHGRVVHDGPPEQRPLLDPGHDHPVGITADECLGQEIHPV